VKEEPKKKQKGNEKEMHEKLEKNKKKQTGWLTPKNGWRRY